MNRCNNFNNVFPEVKLQQESDIDQMQFDRLQFSKQLLVHYSFSFTEMSLRVLLFILLIPLVFGESHLSLSVHEQLLTDSLSDVCCVNSEGEFQVKVTQSLYEAQENASVTMEWTFPPGADLSQVHVICEQSIANTSRNMFVQFNGVEDRQLQDKHFGGRVRVDTDAQRRGLLQVHLWNLSREDSGRYSCDIMISASGNAADCVLNVTCEFTQNTCFI